MTSERLGDQLGRALGARADDDSRIWVLDGDLADSNGAIHFAERHAARFVMAGIAEQNMVSMAAGMAEAGLRPFVFSFAAFLCYRAYDQIRVGLSQCRQPVTLVGSHSGGLGGHNGKSHIALNDLALMLSLPEMEVFAPADAADVGLVLDAILAGGSPAYVRLPRTPIADTDHLPGVPRLVRWLRGPGRVALVSSGLATHWALDVQRRLAAAGHEVGVLHCVRLNAGVELARALGPVEHAIVIEDHYASGGLASSILSSKPGLRVTAHGWPANFTGKAGSEDDLLAAAGLSGGDLARGISKHL